MPGFPDLLNQLAELVQRQYQRTIDPTKEVITTAGATQGLFTAIMALTGAGDEVIVLDPGYDSYEPSIRLAGATPVRLGLNRDFLPDWNRIEDAISDKTKMIITNNPHNPSGRVWSDSDMDALEEIMKRHPQLILLSDEVYEFITFEQPHQSVHQRPALFDRAISVSSFGKTFHVTGWKIGYLIAPEHLMTEIKKVHQFNVFCVNSVAQASLAEYLKITDVNELGGFYQSKRNKFNSLIESSRFELLPCEGTYFQTARYGEISSLGDVEFCQELTIKHGVTAIPISVFNGDGKDEHVIRFCFAKDDQTLQQAAEKLCKI